MDNEVKHVKIVYEADEINSDLDLRFKQMLAKESGMGLWDAGHKDGSRYLTFCRLCLSEAEAKEMSIEEFREKIVKEYSKHPTGCGGSFGEILCYEIHESGLTFKWLAKKWGISVTFLGELIADHCKKL